MDWLGTIMINAGVWIRDQEASISIVLLHDVSDGTDQKTLELQQAERGNHQARFDLETMKGCQSDIYIFAGDFNTTREHYPDRLSIIENEGYVTDLSDTHATILDANLTETDGAPKTVKLDYIYAKSSAGGDPISLKQVTLKGVGGIAADAD